MGYKPGRAFVVEPMRCAAAPSATSGALIDECGACAVDDAENWMCPAVGPGHGKDNGCVLLKADVSQRRCKDLGPWGWSMTADSFETLKRVVETYSVANNFFDAVLEWNVVELEEHPTAEGECVCGQQNLVKMFTIRNHSNDAELFPIGSHCVHHFGRKDLDLQVTVLSDLLLLRKKILEGKRVSLTSEYFSRAMLEWLFDQGAFPSDGFNGGNGENDYLFLVDMFNKRNKDSLSRRQEGKIYQLLKCKVIPFIREHPALA